MMVFARQPIATFNPLVKEVIGHSQFNIGTSLGTDEVHSRRRFVRKDMCYASLKNEWTAYWTNPRTIPLLASSSGERVIQTVVSEWESLTRLL